MIAPEEVEGTVEKLELLAPPGDDRPGGVAHRSALAELDVLERPEASVDLAGADLEAQAAKRTVEEHQLLEQLAPALGLSFGMLEGRLVREV